MNLDRIFNAAYGGMTKKANIADSPMHNSYGIGYHQSATGQKKQYFKGFNKELIDRGFREAGDRKWDSVYKTWLPAFKAKMSSTPTFGDAWNTYLSMPDKRKPGRQIFYTEPQRSFYVGYHQGVINKDFPQAPTWVNASIYEKGGAAANRRGIYKDLKDSEFAQFEKTYKEWKKTILENVKEKFKYKPETLKKQESWLNSPDVRNFDSDGPPEATDRAPRSPGDLPEVIDFGEKLTDYDRFYGDRGATDKQKRQLQKAYRDYFAKIHKWFLHYFGIGTSSDVTVAWFSGKSQSDSQWIQENRYKVSNALIQTINDLETIIRKIDGGKIESDILLNPKDHLSIYSSQYSSVIDKSRVDRGIDAIRSYHDKLKQHLYRIFT